MSRKNTICGIYRVLSAAIKIIESGSNAQKQGSLLTKFREIMQYGLYSACFMLMVVF